MRPATKLLYIVMTLMMCLATSCMNGGEPVAVMPSAPTNTLIPTRELVAVIHGGPTNTPIPTVVEPGLAYGVPCKPPCWRGVVPGQSTRQETAQAVEQLYADGWADHIIGDNSVEWRYEIYPSPFTSEGRVDIYLDGNVVKKIYGTVLFYYSVGTLVEQFGPPEGIRSNEGVCSSCEEWEPPESLYTPENGLWVDLLYPTQGLWFWLETPRDGIGCICPEMKVVYFCYYAPVSMQEAMNDNYLANLCSPGLIDVAEEDLVEWHGFGGGY